MVNEEKNAARERAIQIKTKGAKNAYKLARTKERRLFRKKVRQLDEEAIRWLYTKSDKLDCKNYRGICHLNVTYKVFTKILYDRLLPHANVAVQHYQAGFQSGESTTDLLFSLRQILEKCNEFNITTHHLFIDFKAAYDTIIRNEDYVGISDLNFPTKLIRLTKATLTIVMCPEKD
jgi:DNA modification methylase